MTNDTDSNINGAIATEGRTPTQILDDLRELATRLGAGAPSDDAAIDAFMNQADAVLDAAIDAFDVPTLRRLVEEPRLWTVEIEMPADDLADAIRQACVYFAAQYLTVAVHEALGGHRWAGVAERAREHIARHEAAASASSDVPVRVRSGGLAIVADALGARFAGDPLAAAKAFGVEFKMGDLGAAAMAFAQARTSGSGVATIAVSPAIADADVARLAALGLAHFLLHDRRNAYIWGLEGPFILDQTEAETSEATAFAAAFLAHLGGA